MVTPPPSAPVHHVLLNEDGKLKDAATELPLIRNHIHNLAETAATWGLPEVAGVYAGNVPDEVVEFAGAWLMPEGYAGGKRMRRFVNPRYVHAHRYTEVITECQCGATITRNYEDDYTALDGEHEHTDACQPYYRLETRAKLSRRRHAMVVRLGRLGWTGSDMAPRLGVTANTIGGLAKGYGLTLQDLRDDYRHRAGATYAHLVRNHGYPAEEVAEVYDHRRTTLTRWAKEYAGMDAERGDNQFTRNAKGQFTWSPVVGDD